MPGVVAEELTFIDPLVQEPDGEVDSTPVIKVPPDTFPATVKAPDTLVVPDADQSITAVVPSAP
jgi:hypothetical protein